MFEPLMTENGELVASFGLIIGVDPGRGMGLMFILIGLLAALTVLCGFPHPRIRNVEQELPDMVDD